MAINNRIEYEEIENLCLDPKNLRIGRENTQADLKQSEILGIMSDWNLEELAYSFIESGFWPQEALLVVEEELNGEDKKIVVEGNRRLAALNYLKDACEGRPYSRKWEMITN